MVLSERIAKGVVWGAVAAGYAWLFGPKIAATGVPEALYGLPLELWAFGAAIVLFVVVESRGRWREYAEGPKGTSDAVLFAGFFIPSGSEGRLTNAGNSHGLEYVFLGTLREALAGHRLNRSEMRIEGFDLPLRVVDHRPPRGYAAAHDRESFARIAAGLSRKRLGVIWATLQGDGTVEGFEILVNPDRYYGGSLFLITLDKIKRFVDRAGAPPPAKVEFAARVLAATWCGGYTDQLNESGRWYDAMSMVADSERLLEEALEDLREQWPEGTDVVRKQRKALMPAAIRAHASTMWFGGQKVVALERLMDGLAIDPLAPIGSRAEFHTFYDNWYAFTLSEHFNDFSTFVNERSENPLPPLKNITPRFADAAFAGLPPVDALLFLGRLQEVLKYGEELEERVERWFGDLHSAHPDNPFVLVFWADARKEISWAKYGSREFAPHAPTMLRSAEKLEEAYKLDPSLDVVATRLSVILLGIAIACEGTPDFDNLLEKSNTWATKGAAYWRKHIPEGFPAYPHP